MKKRSKQLLLKRCIKVSLNKLESSHRQQSSDWSGTGGGGGGGGTPGEAATIEVGTTTTLNPGQDATVTNSGTENAAIFNFGIPQGEKGEDGAHWRDIRRQGSLDYVGPPVGIVDPEDGDLYIDSNGDGWAYDGADWTNVGQIQGPPGPEGPTVTTTTPWTKVQQQSP